MLCTCTFFFYQVLNKLKHVAEDACFSNATSAQNNEKNRYSNKLPSMLIGVEACFQKKKYIIFT